jgi:DNA-binding MarR family transcriptional regulator
MTKLSDAQAILLSAAAQRSDGNLLPLPGSLRGGAAAKVVGALLARGFAREEVTDRTTRADSALNTVWRNEDDGRAVLLKVTPEGLAAIGVEPAAREPEAWLAGEAVDYRFNEGTNSAGEPAAGLPSAAEATPAGASRKRGRPKATEPAEAPKKRGRPKKAAAEPAAPAPRKARDDTKQAQLIAMLRRKEGATIAQIVAATGWQPHTVRGAFAGALKKKLGLTVTSEKVEGGQRVYRLPAEG